MKRKTWTSCLTAALMAWAVALCAMGCVVSGFKFDTVSMGKLALLWGGVSALCAVCFRLRRGGLVLLCAGALAAGFLWRQGTLWEQVKVLLYCISIRYDNAYGWGRLNLGITGTDLPLDGVFGILGILAAAGVCWTVSRRKNVLFALPAALMPLVSCLVVTDTVPSEGYLFGLILALTLLLMTDWVRRKGSGTDTSLTALLAVPVAAALAVLFLAVPQKDYVNHAAEWQGRLLSWGEQLLGLAEDVSEELSAGAGVSPAERVNLSTLGPRTLWNTSVMEVTSTFGGTLYLRGQDYDSYSGTDWTASQDRTEVFGRGEALVSDQDVTPRIRIETYGVKQVLYIPYDIADEITLTGGCAENTERLTEYSFACGSASDGDISGDGRYTRLQTNHAWAEELAREITAGVLTRQGQAEAIAGYVRSSASYDLNTARPPAGTEDFARWFLEESDTGYCVHFATAATVLLRAAGIPARYVEGYVVTCRAGEQTLVTGKMAHAWAEYYDDGRWNVLEATPAAESRPEETEQPSVPRETARASEPEEANVTRPVRRDPQNGTAPGISGETPGRAPRAELPGWVKTALKWVLTVLLAAAAVWGQSELRLYYKRRCWHQGAPNSRALARWNQVSRLAWVLKLPIPGELEALAQKARFSQHTLTREELQQFEHARKELWQTAPAMVPWKKCILRLVFALKP